VNVAGVEQRLLAARRVAIEAGRAARRFFDLRADLVVVEKGLQDYVSEADRAVEQVVLDGLRAEFPADAFLGEETGGEVGNPTWLIDPIDGTTNFLAGIPHFAVSIGFVAEGRAQAGVIYDPATDELFWARRGGGAWLTVGSSDQRLAVRDTDRLAGTLLSLGHSTRSSAAAFVRLITALLDRGAEFRRFGSATLSLAWLAAGRTHASFEAHLNPWDAIAGMVIAEEAGARVDRFPTGADLPRGGRALASAPGLYGPLEELIDGAGFA
jgi:myo-inositol-1(or 4)-monophosphatase